MQYRQLGESELKVSTLAFGAWQLGDPAYWGGANGSDPYAAVHAALDEGINLFDTAEGYGDGESERELGKALGAHRDEVYIASKVFPENCHPHDLKASCEASLKRLGTDRIDLYQIHWPSREVPFEDTCAAMVQLRDEGKIRYIGLSNFGVEDMDTWTAQGPAVSNQLVYNFATRVIEWEILPACRRHNLGVLAYMPLMQGLLAGRWNRVQDIPIKRRRFRHFSSDREETRHGEQGCETLLMDTLFALGNFSDAINIPMPVVSLWWLLAQPGVASIIVGSRNADQLRKNVQAAEIDLGPAALAQLNELSGPLKGSLGANADVCESAANSRVR